MKELHQLLATLDEYKNKSNNVVAEGTKTFSDRHGHFTGILKVYKPFNEEDGEKIPDEKKEIVTTVSEKLNYVKEDVIKFIDQELTRNETNCSGKATGEVTINNKKYNLSVSSLMDLEKQLQKIRYLYSVIPTLEPTKTWAKDETIDRNIYISDKEIRYRTKKDYYPVTITKATEKHPETAQLLTSDIQIGQTVTIHKSGMITSKDKSMLLKRIDTLILEVKAAKAKANKAEIEKAEIGKEIFDFINQGII